MDPNQIKGKSTAFVMGYEDGFAGCDETDLGFWCVRDLMDYQEGVVQGRSDKEAGYDPDLASA